MDLPDSVDIPVINSDDLTCQTCGAGLLWGGRGRKPKYCPDCKPKRTSSTPTGRRSTGDVEAAMAALSVLEEALTVPLKIFAPTAGGVWQDQLPGLRERNKPILETQPKLCKSIVKTSGNAGPVALLGSYMLALAPVLMLARAEMTARRNTTATREVPSYTEPVEEPPAPNDLDSMVFARD